MSPFSAPGDLLGSTGAMPQGAKVITRLHKCGVGDRVRGFVAISAPVAPKSQGGTWKETFSIYAALLSPAPAKAPWHACMMDSSS